MHANSGLTCSCWGSRSGKFCAADRLWISDSRASLAGKRELAQLNPFDLVVLLTAVEIPSRMPSSVTTTTVTAGSSGPPTLLAGELLGRARLYGHHNSSASWKAMKRC